MLSKSFRTLFFTVFAALVAVASPGQAQAADGCKVLLCLAGNWKNISECVPPVREAMRDVARGRSWPQCSMVSGSGEAAGANGTRMNMTPAYAPDACPPQYTHEIRFDGGVTWTCDYAGFIDVFVEGQPWSRVWWAMDESTSTEYFPAARAQLPADQLDPKFETDLAAYLEAKRLAEEAAANAPIVL